MQPLYSTRSMDNLREPAPAEIRRAVSSNQVVGVQQSSQHQQIVKTRRGSTLPRTAVEKQAGEDDIDEDYSLR